MRLHRITLRDLKGVAERSVDLPDSGIVVLEGPNEVGKSTMLEAFDRLLDLSATSVSRRAKALQPADRDVGPFVEAEFTVGGHRVRFAKRWLKQPMTELHVLSPTPEHHTGSAAQARLDQLVAGSLDRTLWDALRFAQSGDGSLIPLVSSSVLREALDAAAGARMHAQEGEKVLDEVEKEYRTYYTPTGRPTGEYRSAMTRCTQAQEAVADAHRRVQEAQDLLDRLAGSRAEVSRLRELIDGCETEYAEMAAQLDQAQGLVAAHERATSLLAAAELTAREAREQEERRRADARRVDHLRDSLGRARHQLDQDLLRAEAVLELATATAERRTRAEAAQEVAEEVARRAREGVERCELVTRRDELETLTRRVREIQGQLADLEQAAPRCEVSTSQLRALEQLHREWEVLEGIHRASSASVRVESLGAPVKVGEKEVLGAGEVREMSLAHELMVTVAGAVRVVIEPEAGTRNRVAQLVQARAHLDAALAPLGVDTLDQLRELAEETSRHAAALARLHHELQVVLAPLGRQAAEAGHQARSRQLPQALLDRREEVAERLRALPPVTVTATQGGTGQSRGVDLPIDTAGARDADPVVDREVGAAVDTDGDLTGDLDDARAVQRAADEAVRQARAEVRQAREAAHDAELAVQDLTAGIERARGSIEADQRQLEALTVALEQVRAECSDEQLAAVAAERATALAEAQTLAEQAQQAVGAAGVGAIEGRLAGIGQRLRVLRGQVEAETRTLHTLSGRVEAAAGEGRQELYLIAVGELGTAESELAALDRRARAVRHLRTVLHSHRDAAHQAYVRPFTDALEGLGRQVYGDTFAVTVDDELTLQRRTLNGVTVPFDQLSGGAKEQLGILSRLAVAGLVDPEQGVPVVIDDALGYSDPDRLQQMAQVLGTSAQGGDVQLILLTCTPDRYSSIPGAQQVRLTA